MASPTARAPTWARALLIANLMLLVVWFVDEVLLVDDLAFAWTEGHAQGEAISDEQLARRLAGTRALRLHVHGRITPLHWFDRDNHFHVWLTRGGYAIGTTYDLGNGADDYAAYLAKCRVTWEPDGVRFVEPRGYALWLPATEFHLLD